MATEVTDYVNVSARIAGLGCRYPNGLALLPVNFESASSQETFRQASETATVKKLFRNAGVPLDEIVDRNQRPPYIDNHSLDCVLPTLFVSAALFSGNQYCISVALEILASYATDFFKGMGGARVVKLEIVVEKERNKTCRKISYYGDVEGLKALPDVIREVANE